MRRTADTPAAGAGIARSSLPLAAVESAFAVGGSGLSVSKFVRWFDDKHGRERIGKDWVKDHLACGVKPNIATAAAICGRDANDSPFLPELVRATAARFTAKGVSADEGYLSADNVEAVAAVGATPFIAPKSNTAGAAAGLFERMIHCYQFRRAEFLPHYQKRSNVGSTFSAVKRKFGDNVRSRLDAAKVNEVLAKLVCFNLTRVILFQCELGVEVPFWPDGGTSASDERPDVLPLVRPG